MSASFQAALRRGTERLRAAGVDTPRLDAEVLLMHLTGLDRTQLYVKLPDPLAPSDETRFDDLIGRRAEGEPIAYLTGSREFMGLDFFVDRRVLIPRPETEGLVERALAWIAQQTRPLRVVDVGTGSGAIALSIDRLARAEDRLFIIASDNSREALEVARINRERLGARRVQFVNGSLLDWACTPFDLIVANLPYLRDEQRHPGIAREPDQALYAADRGFALYAELLRQSSTRLAPGGLILCEIDPDQRARALELAQAAHPPAAVRVEPDLAGLDRYLIVERRPA
ncbi:MAG TPA: peptide chain release factor N(5)-glutamine methyltransferase [Nitrolancea sp.]|nr:peptide chain release factor N(5)-glutamine methyltransferase [Nitrolancea sp.]